MPGTIKRYTDADALAKAAAELFVEQAEHAIREQGVFRVALSGGATPARLFRLLADASYAEFTDWSRIHLYWGDERCVPPDHPDSNYRMTREVLLDHVPIPTENVHRMLGELHPPVAAAQYEWLLTQHLTETGCFDLVFLGMGEDGHTASLFPRSDAVKKEVLDHPKRWVMANFVTTKDAWRITLTPRPLNAAAQVVFLIAGAGKAERLLDVLHGPYQPYVWPAQLIQPEPGELIWMVDQAAAKWLPKDA